jgi:glycosyltransferase involved in cell wall biosynthesis
MKILQVSTADIGGGAEKIARNLFQFYRAQGHDSGLAVGYKRSDDPGIFLIPNDHCRGTWARTWFAAGNLFSPLIGRVKGAGLLRNLLHQIGEPTRYSKIRQGYEDFDFPGTGRLLDLPAKRPDIVHGHNLHGDYFDLRVLPWLSQQVPVVLTLHDAWLLSGHCAHSFDCECWKTGCGKCPDLTIHPSIRSDGTAYNWQRKRDIFSKSRLYVSTPSSWLMQKVEQSILAPAIVEARVIPNGVDLSIFHPADKHKVRAALGIPLDAIVLLFAANSFHKDSWKDHKTMKFAIAMISECLSNKKILFIALGEKKKPETIGKAVVNFIPLKKNPEEVAFYYQCADIYIHLAQADTFPNMVLEALACSVPVVATKIGGIPEQVVDGVTGFLTPPGNAEAVSGRVVNLIENEELRWKMSTQAAIDVKRRFDLEQQVDEYLKWYRKIVKN